MTKIKSEWYCDLHRTKDLLGFEKDVINIILTDKSDDLIPLLDEKDKNDFLEYQDSILQDINRLALMVSLDVTEYAKMNQKEFALHVMGNHKDKSKFYFEVRKGKNAIDVIKKYFLESTTSGGKVEERLGNLLTMRWKQRKIIE
jgi:hypothetical protein